MKSPCIDVCVFDGPTGWCVACGRTRPECAAWKKTTPYRQKAILADLPRRLARLGPSGRILLQNLEQP